MGRPGTALHPCGMVLGMAEDGQRAHLSPRISPSTWCLHIQLPSRQSQRRDDCLSPLAKKHQPEHSPKLELQGTATSFSCSSAVTGQRWKERTETRTGTVNSFLSFSGESGKAVSLPLPQNGNEQESNHLVTCSALASIPIPRSFGNPGRGSSHPPGSRQQWGCLLALGLGRCLLPALLPRCKQHRQQVYLH